VSSPWRTPEPSEQELFGERWGCDGGAKYTLGRSYAYEAKPGGGADTVY
jgi:hypothetical protein